MPDSAYDQLMHVYATIDATEVDVHAYRHLLVNEARADAIKVDEGSAKTKVSGWPFAVKEVFDVKGVPTSGGSAAFSDRIPDQDATVVRRLRDAGAVLVGTQISHELTCGADEPPTRNPWNLDCYPGGSSAGAGVSVSVGSTRVALGTDAAGSVRIPACMTGTVGFKPTAGRVSTAGLFRKATAPSIDNIGIIARSVEDVHSVLSVIEGCDVDDPRTLWTDYSALEKLEMPDISDVTFAVLGLETTATLNTVFPLDPCIESAFAATCEVYRQSGARFETVEIPELATAIEAVVSLFSAELAAGHREDLLSKVSEYFPAIFEMLKSNLTPDAEALRSAVTQRSVIRAAVNNALDCFSASALLTPTTPRVAMELDGFDPGQELGSLIPYTCPFNLTGHPALSLPSGFSKQGLPIGHQIVGKLGHDQEILRFGYLFQSQTDWHTRRPALPISP